MRMFGHPMMMMNMMMSLSEAFENNYRGINALGADAVKKQPSEMSSSNGNAFHCTGDDFEVHKWRYHRVVSPAVND